MRETVLRPGPVINFDLVDLEPEYTDKQRGMYDSLLSGTIENKDLQHQFTDWEKMTLKEGLEKDKDYHVITMVNWMKLNAAFGGCPEIPIFDYHNINTITKPDGEVVEEKTTFLDFNPIKVKLTPTTGTGENTGESFQLLVSRNMTV